MIDIENLVFDTLYNGLIALHPNANITSGYDEQNAKPLTVVARQTNSQPYRASATDDCSENHTRVTFEIEVFSTKESTGRSECKTVLADADTIMQGMKFRRVHLNRPINVDRTRWRQYARYEVIVGKPVTYDKGTANERTVFQMYRR